MELHYRHTDTLLLKVQGTYGRDCFFFAPWVSFRMLFLLHIHVTIYIIIIFVKPYFLLYQNSFFSSPYLDLKNNI